MSGDSLVEMRGIHKRFGETVALRDVDFTVGRNEVVGLVGDNGAGKSTLIKILTGVYQADAGEIRYKGRPVRIASPAHARSLGIEPVHQFGSTVDELSIWENFFLGREACRHLGPIRILDKKTMREITRQTLERLGIHLDDIERPIGTLSGGERQAVVMGRAVHFGGELLVLDEPTAALSLRETERVLEYISNVRRMGRSVILITHITRHVYPVADRFVVLERSMKIADVAKDRITRKELEDLIVRGRLEAERI
ncbi:MAG: ATP-binding cassette domain-containing protein [Armatimonadota bacterium]|nr:ATP-binding cassette domain-containing protein [Armatimonadota bacterium]MDR7422698.1 ATP-binding cassette domain-containing protein [Armatimonadota bacterium]MDR7455161.1 ATP-binding cassette domain-containing protein [Armatimonadota bacterium]MDR7457980.1 ATP-binding cassette domain-containing protein [Armatimonadota bacterium]MDR7497239.1 ATP-binding cassette domain-containing protein [Armatimonadota bacterium]